MDELATSGLSNIVLGSAVATIGFGAALTYILLSNKSPNGDENPPDAALSCDTSLAGSEIDKETYPGGHLTIYYGSQTGTAETFANDMQRESEKYGFKARVVDLEDAGEESELQSELLNEAYKDEDGRSRAVFLMATYGEGEPTDNALNFVTWIQQKSGVKGVATNIELEEEQKDDSCLTGFDYAVFGLGNTQYEHYNAMGKLVHSALSKTGAQCIAEMGLGDDDQDLESDFEQWRENVFWPAMTKRFITSDSGFSSKSISQGHGHVTQEQLPKCDFVAKYLDGVSSNNIPPVSISDQEVNVNSSTKHYFTAVDCPVTTIRELRSPEDSGSTVHVEIDISNSPVQYKTADNLAVLPINDSAIVESVASALSYNLDAVFELKPNSDKKFQHFFPNPCTVRECLSRYIDLTSPPRRSELKLIAQFASDPLDRQALLRMSSKEGRAEYREKIMDAKIGTVDIITKLCKSVKMPLEHLIQICPHLQPRFYTIASSSSVNPDSVHLTVAVIKEERKDGSFLNGVCSTYLAHEKGTVRVFCRDSTFRLPTDVTKPILMIGPGTGIAPMRALLQERSHMKHKLNLPVGPNMLYFGCKKRKLDYIYQNEIEEFEKSGDLYKLRLAFSREQANKIYVQDLLQEDADTVWDMIEKKGAYIYICGATEMGHDVCAVLRKIAMTQGGLQNEEAAKKYFDQLHHDGRFVQELWA